MWDLDYNQRLRNLARQGIYLGTSSWKYLGWVGSIYSKDRYLYRGKMARTRFDRDCLAEYAETFPTVGVDFSFYNWPQESALRAMDEQTPEDFLFSFKVTETVTVKHFPQHARYRDRAGNENPDFLNPEIFIEYFLGPLSLLGPKVGMVIFEFGQFHRDSFERGRDFVRTLDAFLTELPKTFRYAVEIRNKTFLKPQYFEMLAKHQVSHVLNAWTHMPSIGEQLDLMQDPGAGAWVCRALLTRQRSYAEAVKAFAPYKKATAPDHNLRMDLARLLNRAKQGKTQAFVYINNRAEGNAPTTIAAVLNLLT
ncbi:MAG: DUF72 domain-containing protein [Candidatus Omnitrophica bacterium]|nr:DUF72 domain-containing protein [Candidatus Omnitrophota bacterium]